MGVDWHLGEGSGVEAKRGTRLGRHAVGIRPWTFLTLTLGLSWLTGFSAAALSASIPGWAVTALRYLSGVAPLVVAAGLLHLWSDRTTRRDFWRRVVDFGRIGAGWYAVILLYAPVKTGLAAVADLLLGGSGIAPEMWADLVDQPLLVVPTLLFWVVFGPLPEEPGWRGYALDGLQACRSALSASLIVGVAWSLWHVPLFFIAGTWQAEVVGLGTQRFWLYMLAMVIESILYTWIFNNTDRSTLAAILLHFSVNACGELFALSHRGEVISFALTAVAALIVVAGWGPRTLTGTGKRGR